MRTDSPKRPRNQRDRLPALDPGRREEQLEGHLVPTAQHEVSVQPATRGLRPITPILHLRPQVPAGLVDAHGKQERVIRQALQVDEPRVPAVQLDVCLAGHCARVRARDALAEDRHPLHGQKGHVQVGAGLVQLADLVFGAAEEGGFEGGWFLVGLLGCGLTGAVGVVAGGRVCVSSFCWIVSWDSPSPDHRD